MYLMMAMQNADIALPEEDAVDIGHRIAGDEILDLAVIVGEHDDRHVKPGLFDLARPARRRSSGRPSDW